MSTTAFQRRVLKTLAQARIENGERYIAGGLALNEVLQGLRRSKDIDIFHDSDEVVERSFDADAARLEKAMLECRPTRRSPGFIEAIVAADGDETVLQWVRDSAFRFFPLVEHPELGLALHPFDLATNKVLAVVGRLEVRDWLDVLLCHRQLQPLGYLAWAATGKDLGFNPQLILSEAARTCRYSQKEVDREVFDGPAPDVARLSVDWRCTLAEAHEIVAALPAEYVGTCVLDARGELCRAPIAELQALKAVDGLRFHEGTLGGAWPKIVR